ncbi:MAG: Uncharacterised protein [Synechococcus sp. CC9902]|nr:MAG: Uncharacterised protein [Synechococcus sp. CC9902]
MGLIRCCDAIAVGISQLVQLVPAMPLMLRQMAELLLAPGCAVAVLDNDLHLHATPMGSNESPGHLRQRQLLNSHFDAVLS